MKILLTGASGYVGARLYFDISKVYSTVGTYATHQLTPSLIHLDITDSQAVKDCFSLQIPDVIIHVANQADPRWCEAYPDDAIRLNQTATEYICNAAQSIGARLIYLSSFAAYKPTNVYARTKYESEQIVEGVKTGFLIIRPAYILGYSPNTTNDRAFNRILKNLDQKIPAVYDTSWHVQPTYIRHISEIILLCLKREIWNETIPVTVPELATRFSCARDILTPFHVSVSSVDNHDTTPTISVDSSKLKSLKLPQYSYQEMIDNIIDEIKHRERFVL